ncbi:uncharacterized protein LOC116116829 [Pistacia vera]|uniref:uncharacterized protein LOC116116829 n=1 Tax=Pistacia vera TaxID=55513 RepID=UPI0012635FF0|nr:uncharacterized protein LOC116116829 [Pistacia vera]
MQSEFEMTDLGEMTYFLGMEINQSADGIFVCQRKYANEILKKFNMENCNPVSTPLVQNQKLCREDGASKVDESMYRNLVGCLLYLTTTRLDLMYASSLLSRFMNEPREIHFRAAKRVLRYIKGSADLGIWFRKSEKFNLVGFTDSDWVGSLDDMRSTSGYVFSLNSGAFCWLSKKQENVA